MTLDLRGFELGGEIGDTGEAPGAHDPVSAVLDVLGQAFGVAAEPGAPGSGARQRTWLDTFDWRLNRAGLVLEYERARRGSRLLLSKDEVPQAEQPVSGWPSSRPRLAEDLPAGPVRDQIVKLASPRALLPMATAAGTVSVTRLLNADGKTVARLIVDRSTVTRETTPSGCLRAWPSPKSAATPSRPARPPGSWPRPPASARPSTVRSRRPCTPSAAAPTTTRGGVAADITAQMPASVAVATVLLGLLDTLEPNVDGTVRDIDTEFLHDLRVAVRRTRSALKLLGDVLPGGLAQAYAAEFKWLGDLTTPTRDLDVYLLGFGAMAAQLVAAHRPTSSRSTPTWSGAARGSCGGWPPGCARPGSGPSPMTGARRWSRSATRAARPGAAASPPTELAAATTARSRRVVAQGSAITADSPPESLHDLRKRCKELRYLLEFFASLHDPVAYRKVVGN